MAAIGLNVYSVVHYRRLFALSMAVIGLGAEKMTLMRMIHAAGSTGPG